MFFPAFPLAFRRTSAPLANALFPSLPLSFLLLSLLPGLLLVGVFPRILQPRASGGRENLQSADLDALIADNDWHQVAKYIAMMRGEDEDGMGSRPVQSNGARGGSVPLRKKVEDDWDLESDAGDSLSDWESMTSGPSQSFSGRQRRDSAPPAPPKDSPLKKTMQV